MHLASAAALELWGVGKSYGLFTQKRALGGVTLRVERGECFGHAGANGAGKTTLIRILLGLIDPDEGEARLLGERPDDPEVRRRVGFVPEAATLPETASPRALVKRWARLRGLPARDSLAQGVETLERLGMKELLDRPSGKLSKGERQRTLLALAMLGSPELLVLDEPTDGLDPLGRARMREVIRGECDAGRTVFLNSHLLAETERICTRVGILHRGQLVRVEHLAGRRGAGEPATSAVVLASPLSGEQLARARVRSVPQGSTPLRDLLPAGATVLVAHQDLQELNGALDRLRAEGALLVEVRRVKADLEAALAEVAGDGVRTEPSAPAALESARPESAPEGSAPLETPPAAPGPLAPAPPLPPHRFRPLRAPLATWRVAQEIAADLSSRRVGWIALGAAGLAFAAFFAAVRSHVALGAAAMADRFGAGGLTDPAEVAGFISSWAAKIFFWSTLMGGPLLAAVFAASHFDARRTVLLYSQPLTRADYTLGIWTATCGLALGSNALLFALLWGSLRWLGIAAPLALLLAPLAWTLAFGAVLALQLLAAHALRSALFLGLIGLALVWGTATLGASRGGMMRHSPYYWSGLLYALLPRTADLAESAGRLASGHAPRLFWMLPTAALLAAYLLILRTVSLRSER